jgi:hypothetical protein
MVKKSLREQLSETDYWRTVRSFNARQSAALAERDRIQGTRPTRPTAIPRWGLRYTEPYACKLGMHRWVTDVHMNIPILKCARCGAFRFKDIAEGTATKREIREVGVPKVEPIKTKIDIANQYYRRRDHDPRK